MSADRCPSCTAAVRPDASWCGQCYADLRPAPEPAPAPAPAPAPVQAPAPAATLVVDPLDPLGLPVDLLSSGSPEPSAAAIPEVPAQAAPALPGALPVDPAPTTWPCLRCGTTVPLAEDECPNCHAKFLDPVLPGTEKTLLDRLPRERK